MNFPHTGAPPIWGTVSVAATRRRCGTESWFWIRGLWACWGLAGLYLLVILDWVILL